MSKKILQQLRQEARELSQRRRPVFYDHYQDELRYSKEVFFSHSLILRCREDVLPFLNDDFGHGVEHSKKVAIESGAIVLAETGGWDTDLGRHVAVLAQLSGLMHDICRLQGEHAKQGAELSFRILRDYPVTSQDKDMIAFAIANHEAFKANRPASDFQTDLLNGALYDADKFRWGPDNFVTTLWEICDYLEWPLGKIHERFPQGLDVVRSIADTFRTRTGQIYGPEFIDIGLELGGYLYRRMEQVIQ
jgi:hypothetical protein